MLLVTLLRMSLRKALAPITPLAMAGTRQGLGCFPVSLPRYISRLAVLDSRFAIRSGTAVKVST